MLLFNKVKKLIFFFLNSKSLIQVFGACALLVDSSQSATGSIHVGAQDEEEWEAGLTSYINHLQNDSLHL